MTGVFKPRMGILPPSQQRLWPELRPAAELGFALYGGTAIALRLGHRDSVDFDFFSEKPLDRDAIHAAFPFIAISPVLQDQQNTFTVNVPYGNSEREHVKVSFFGTIGFGRVGEPEVTEDGVLHVASLDDLMATKVKVILQRAEAKDYRDIAAMVSAGVSLAKGLSAARALYGINFQPSESLKAMVYFDDGDLRTLTKDERTCLVKAVSEVRDLPHVEVLSHRLIASNFSLNLPQYRVLRMEEPDHDYHVYAEPVEVTNACPHCQSNRLTSWGTREQVFKDLPMHGKRVGIYIDTKRFRCQSCSKTFSQQLPMLAENRMMTERLMKWVGEQSLKRTFISLAEETGVVEGTIRNIFRDFINVLEETVRFETPKWMGIDEIYLIKPRCVITNIENNTVVDMLVNRNKDTVAKYLTRMAHHDKVQFVAMDMWAPYRDAVTAVMPQAKIVIDKFHVIKMANEAMEKARKGIRADLDLKQKRGLMHDRFVLLKRQRDLTDKEAFNLDGWTRNYPVLGEAYRLKEAFYAVYETSTSREDALTRFDAWSKSVPPEIRPYFSDLIRAFTNWQPWILNYFDHKITNAYIESLNSLIRVMDRMGRGYSFEVLRGKILFTEGLHKHKDVGSPKNYGVDMSTLIRMIETGEL